MAPARRDGAGWGPWRQLPAAPPPSCLAIAKVLGGQWGLLFSWTATAWIQRMDLLQSLLLSFKFKVEIFMLDVTYQSWCTKKAFWPPSYEYRRSAVPHNGLRANIFSTLDAGPSCSIQNPRINNDCCDKQQPRGFLAQWIKYLWNVLMCPFVLHAELNYV
jgi:hypothetical protein